MALVGITAYYARQTKRLVTQTEELVKKPFLPHLSAHYDPKMQYSSDITQRELEKDSKSTNKTEWISVTARVRRKEQDLFNLQLKRLQCQTLNELAKEIIAGKLKRISEDEEIEIMKVQAQSGGLLTSQSGYYDFYKKVDTNDFLKWLKDNYHIHTANCYYMLL